MSPAASTSFNKLLPRSNNPISSSSGVENRPEAPSSRPRFDSTKTSHRLREGLPQQLPSFSMSSIRKGRRSMFKEIGLSDDDEFGNDHYGERSSSSTASRMMTEREFHEIIGLSFEDQHASPPRPRERRDSSDDEGGDDMSKTRLGWLSKLSPKRPKIKSAAGAPPSAVSGLHRLSMIALLIAVFIPAISYRNGYEKVEISGADAGVIPVKRDIVLDTRADSPVDVCLRWAHQSAMVNGTIYIYGGQAKTEGDQKQNTWNNNLLILDTTKSWEISSPAMTGLARPSGPPAVSLGYLWNDYNNLFLYGGEFADNPYVEPEPYSTWKYDIAAKSWIEFNNPKTSAGNASEPAGVPIQRAGEGAGISVPELGRSWYFGGHLDLATTQGWSNQIDRVYLRGLLEFTHPGYANDGVDSLHASGAGEGGAYRNITEGGIQDSSGFTERADGQLVFVPGWGPSGILLGLGGGSTANKDSTAEFASMSTIDVYDIQTSVWYHQETRGEAPPVRVNPCAVVFSAPDASSFNIYLYGGQNLLPVAGQTQYTDLWILTVPSFTWIKVDIEKDGEPPARAGHTCHARDGQMIVVGGYIGQTTQCDGAGVYNFNASSLKWQNQFAAADHPADLSPDNTILADSYGYQVPDVVQSVIGGNSDGGATATHPASGPASDGPFATGKPPSSHGATVTSLPPGVNSDGSPSGGAPKGGLIAAGVVAGVLGVAALYLGFCAWLYRRQVTAYKKHMLAASRYSGTVIPEEGGDAADNGIAHDFSSTTYGGAGAALAGTGGAAAIKEKLRKNKRSGGSSGGESAREQFGWVGQQQQQQRGDHGANQPFLNEPKWGLSDDTSPGNTASSSHKYSSSNKTPRPSEDRNPWGWFESPGSGQTGGGVSRNKSSATRSTASGHSTDGLLDGREPNFFSVVLGPRRALRVVNGMED
ncbi:hypothetical protein PG993_004291 [Apiospora rasikravindrae]|uniref:Kelch repeat-containing protein n=1 Tax=Apiospora rasikravindrae TaxID=990691 RepID=A0ABR1TCD8_9PEZI